MMMMKVAGKTLSISSSIVTVACIVLEIDKARYWSKIAIDSYVLKQSRIFPLQNTRSNRSSSIFRSWFSGPAFSGPAFSAPDIWSCIFSPAFSVLSSFLVVHFLVLHFQSTRANTVANNLIGGNFLRPIQVIPVVSKVK